MTHTAGKLLLNKLLSIDAYVMNHAQIKYSDAHIDYYEYDNRL
jgi:hypothetical protein